MPGKRVQFDEATWQQIDLLGRDQMKDFSELADEAFRDLLRKHGRPMDLKEALRRSAGVTRGLTPKKRSKAGAAWCKSMPRPSTAGWPRRQPGL